MLQEEYLRLAKSVDYVSPDQAERLIGTVLDNLKDLIGAIIVDVWVRTPGQGDVDILRPYLRRSDPQIPAPKDIALTVEAKSLLVWVSEKLRPIWLDITQAQAKSGVDRLTNETIEEKYFRLYDRTRAFAAVPIEYRGQHRAVLTVEAAVPHQIQGYHIDVMKTLSEATGIIIWKASVYEENRKQTNEAIQDFQRANITTKLIPPLNPYRTGFVARPFEERFSIIGRAIETTFQTQRIQASVYQNIPGGPLIVNQLLSQINSSHFGIADITSLNQNVLIEVGALIAANKPLILLRSANDDDRPAPFNIAGYDCYQYEVKGEEIIISDATTTRSLQEFIGKFISINLSRDKVFQDAKEWLGP